MGSEAPSKPEEEAEEEDIIAAVEDIIAAEEVVESVKEVCFAEGDVVMRQGDMVTDEENGLYVLEEGHLKVFKRGPDEDSSGFGKHVFTYTDPGSTFGELALLYSVPRAATVVAQGACRTWCLERDAFATLVQGALQVRAVSNFARMR